MTQVLTFVNIRCAFSDLRDFILLVVTHKGVKMHEHGPEWK